jgi:hypothetical protein
LVQVVSRLVQVLHIVFEVGGGADILYIRHVADHRRRQGGGECLWSINERLEHLTIECGHSSHLFVPNPVIARFVSEFYLPGPMSSLLGLQ